MSLVPSLLQAIVRVGGEAVVLHVGEKPYVVSPAGQVDLSARGLTLDAVNGLLGQLMPAEALGALDEFGAAQHQLPPFAEFPGEGFTVVAARGGDDVWVEIRRRKVAEEDYIPPELFADAGGAGPVSPGQPAAVTSADEDDLALPAAEQLWPEFPAPESPPLAAPPDLALAPLADLTPALLAPDRVEPPPEVLLPEIPLDHPEAAEPAAAMLAEQPVPSTVPSPQPPPSVTTPRPAPVAEARPRTVAPPAASPLPRQAPPVPPPAAVPSQKTAPPPAARIVEAPVRAAEPPPAPLVPPIDEPPTTAVVLPLARNPIRQEVPPPLGGDALAGLDRLLRLAAVRGASTLYLSSGARPSVRVDGDVQVLDGAPVLGPNEVESLLLTLMPTRSAEALRTGVASEWICEVADVGRVRCMSFRDHRGPGGVFRMMPLRAASADQLGLSREIQALTMEPEGLVIVAGPRSSGKGTLLAALVDLINRTRRDHVITVEREINIVHDQSGSFVSQREVSGSIEDMVAVARAALREDPDVLVLEDLRSAGLMNLAFEAAASGQLVVGGFPAHTASGAVDRIIDLYPPENRRQVQLSLAQNLRGVIAQVLLRKTGGGRLAARELLLNTPAVASVLAEGRTSQLPLAIEGGRKHGMVPLNDALVGFVQSGAVDVREAYRRSADRAGFLALLKRQGLDTSALQRLA